MRKIRCVLLFITVACWFAAAQTTKEETAVRNAYAKLAWANRLSAVHRALGKRSDPVAFASKVNAEDVHFEISDVRSGTVTSILTVRYADLVTKPDGQEVLGIATGDFNFSEDASNGSTRQISEFQARPFWTSGQRTQEDWNVPLERVLASMPDGSKYDRYADFSVKVSYKARSRSYRALFLFAASPDGTSTFNPIDTVTNSMAIVAASQRSGYPHVLVESNTLRGDPSIRDWLRSHSVDSEKCAGEELCCDPATVSCGLASGVIQKNLARPIAAGPDLKPKLRRVIDVDCTDYSVAGGPKNDTTSGTEEHISGNHSYFWVGSGDCEYTDPPTGTTCIAEVNTNSQISMNDTGTPAYCHVYGHNESNGYAVAVGASATTTGAGEVRSCLFCTCSVHVTANPLTFDPDNIWKHNDSFSMSCPIYHLTSGTPIIIDTTGRGFSLTSAKDGVTFDLQGNGRPEQVSWTDASGGNAFLVLDRNGNGSIDSGKELFGNHTEQPDSDDPNGFRALAVFDMLAQGGNGDGVIDRRDSVWNSLRLWIDENHDGISQSSELHSLGSLGVTQISLDYSLSRHRDQYGNVFRYKGTLTSDSKNKKLYDVILFGVSDQDLPDVNLAFRKRAGN